jgi:hypothetical protein
MNERFLPVILTPRTILACVLSVGASAAQANVANLAVTSLTVSAHVEESIIPGSTVFSDTQTVPAPLEGTNYVAEILHKMNRGANASGRSTDIQQPFGSARAESNGNGGVGATALLFGSANPAGGAGVSQLASVATWDEEVTNIGSEHETVTLTLHVPSLEVGLINVPPNRSGPSATEQARAEVRLVSAIHHADGTTSNGGSLYFGLRAFEDQVPLGAGVFANFWDVEFLGGSAVTNVFDSFHTNGISQTQSSNPRAYLDEVTVPVTLGTLGAGDWLTFNYTLTASGTTAGGEQGYVAFLGDPFTLDATGRYAPVLGTAPVPLPAGAGLFALGLGALGRMRAQRR